MQDAKLLHVGWLRDLMRLSDPPMPSFGRLAQSCLEHSDWPGEVDLQPRSLATLFSKLDREIDLDWLRDRVDVQRVVCRVLGRPLGDLRVALGEPATLLHGRRLRLADARFARELDLAREALPPGIPERAYTPGSWQHAYWIAPPGAGKSLVGAWLEARSLAQVVSIQGPLDWGRLPASGTLFVEVARGVELPDEVLRALRARASPICVAAPAAVAPEGFDAFASPPIESYLGALIEWLAGRLDGSGHFASSRAEAWMRQVALSHRAVVGFGEVLGLLGAQDEFSPQNLRGKSLDDLGSAFVERRLADALLDTSWGPKSSAHAFEALSQAAARCLVESGLDLSLPRTLEAWAELLATSRETPDEEWLLRALRLDEKEPPQPARAERVAKRLPPSGYRLARSLSLGGLLAARTNEPARADAELTLGPRWLVSLLMSRANATALELSPSAWGAALLEAEKREPLEQALFARLTRGHYRAVELLLEELDATEPSHLAALDACLRQLADAELLGEACPDDLKADLLAAAADALILIGERLEPTLGLAGGGAHRAALAALTLNHPLPERALDPHRTTRTELLSPFAADCVKVALSKDRALALEWLTVARTFTKRGGERQPDLLRLIDALLPGEDRAGDEGPPATSRELELALSWAVREAGESVLSRAWQVVPGAMLATVEDPELLRKLWLRAPVSLLSGLFSSGVPIDFASLLPHHYVAWLESGTPLPARAALHCPLEAVHQAVIRTGPACLAPEALAGLLPRSPRLAKILIDRLATGDSAADRQALEVLPAPALSTLIDALPEDGALLLWSRPALDGVRALLRTRIEKLGPRVEHALGRLRSLEMALGPLRR